MSFRNFEEWLAQVPESISKDPLWDFKTYRMALFLSDLAWFDSEKLLGDERGKGIAWQLIDSAGSIAANIELKRGLGVVMVRIMPVS